MAPSFLAVIILLAPLPDNVRIEVHSYGLEKRYTVTVTQTALDKAPIWKNDAENPPLSARKAMKLASDMKDKLVKDTDDWKWDFESASLKEARTGQWYWLVTFEANVKNGGLAGVAPNLRLIVLMDGTVIEPKVTDDKRR